MFKCLAIKGRFTWIDIAIVKTLINYSNVVAKPCHKIGVIEHVGSKEKRVLVVEPLENLR